MKSSAERAEGFRPVILEITLETQGEVDEFFGVVNHAVFTATFPVFQGLWETLDAFTTPVGFREAWNRLDKILRRW